MNLLRRITGQGPGCIDGLSLFGCRSSIGRRSVHAVPSCVPAGSPAAGARKDPRWLMLNYGVARWNDSAVADAKTVAESLTSTGRHHLRVSLGLAAPPASSFFYYDWPGISATAGDEDPVTHGYVFAAHGDSVLLKVNHQLGGSSYRTNDYFVYKTSAAEPPSLSLLPHPASMLQLSCRDTGLLRRGGDELLVVQINLDSCRRNKVDMWMHRLGSHEWEVKRQVPVVLGGSSDEKVPHERLDSYTTVAVGDRFICSVDYHSGIFVCDMAEESLKLRYVQLPVIPEDDFGSYEDNCGPNNRHSWDMCAAGDSAVRFVSIDPRCCCGHSPSRSVCPNSYKLFAVTTWTLTLTTEKTMAWVKENKLDCDELWGLPGYEGLPRRLAEFPVVSSANLNVVCFMVREGNEKWMIEVDTRNKALLSTVRWTTDVPQEAWLVHVSAKLPWLTSEAPGGTES
ncbi:hypothetical protein ACP70R_024755 [Stipagrostis hirtigluma subsp. patula]